MIDIGWLSTTRSLLPDRLPALRGARAATASPPRTPCGARVLAPVAVSAGDSHTGSSTYRAGTCRPSQSPISRWCRYNILCMKRKSPGKKPPRAGFAGQPGAVWGRRLLRGGCRGTTAANAARGLHRALLGDLAHRHEPEDVAILLQIVVLALGAVLGVGADHPAADAKLLGHLADIAAL